MSARRVWRVMGTLGEKVMTRHYQTRAAADHRAALWEGFGFTVQVTRSEPVIFPEEEGR